ncbi:MAG: restriction endonuclease subunit S, partial [Bacteroidota bacterium]|nr:restriction endonuclease subunit S [Bacteroidota bacterium]
KKITPPPPPQNRGQKQQLIPRRNSGFPWLGNIPAHWQVVQLKRMCVSILTGSTPKNLEIINPEETVNWFTPGDLSDRELELRVSERKLSATILVNNGLSWFPKNSIMIVGVGASLGKVGVTSLAASANQQINVLLIQNLASPWYVAYQLQALREVLFAHSLASTLPILSQQRMGETMVAFPPLEEQHIIVNHIRAKTEEFTVLKRHVNNSIKLFQQKRASLITAAVTGQLALT